MAVRWVVDSETNAALWGELSEMPLRLGGGPGAWVADVGGGNGNFVAPLRRTGARLLTIDVDWDALRTAVDGVRPVAGSLLQLPLRDSTMHGIAGRAVLHHVPDDLDAVLREVKRVVRPGGLVLFQEPTSTNPIAHLARRRLPTERHDPHERPLPYEEYVEAVRRHFEILDESPHFLLSYLLPHIVGRLPEHRRKLLRRVARVLFRWDRRLFAALSGLHRHAAYVSILARRIEDFNGAHLDKTLIRVPS